jgi:hypothetical protein
MRGPIHLVSISLMLCGTAFVHGRSAVPLPFLFLLHGPTSLWLKALFAFLAFMRHTAAFAATMANT